MQRQKMKLSDRAKIFAPYDALKGFKEMLKEQEKIKEQKKELSEEMLEELDNTLSTCKLGMMVKIIYYDNLEEAYFEMSGIFTKLDIIGRYIILVKTKINIDDIYKIEILEKNVFE